MRHKNIRSRAQVRTDYDQSARDYDKVRFGSVGGQYVNKREMEFVASVVQGSSVLEIGTATGRFAECLIKKGAEYVGIDLSLKMLRATRERTEHSASVVQMDGCSLGFRGSFDYALCIRTFHFLPKPVAASVDAMGTRKTLALADARLCVGNTAIRPKPESWVFDKLSSNPLIFHRDRRGFFGTAWD